LAVEQDGRLAQCEQFRLPIGLGGAVAPVPAPALPQSSALVPDVAPAAPQAAIRGPDRFGQAPIALAASPAKCDGAIDAVNGMPPPQDGLAAEAALRMQGWLTLLPEPRRTVDKVYVVLTDARGQMRFALAHAIERPDLASGFKQANLVGAGYELNADVAALQGVYTIGLAVEQNGKLARCEQFGVRVTFKGTSGQTAALAAPGAGRFAAAPKGLTTGSAKCDGAIDLVNDVPPAKAGLSVRNALRMQGWISLLPEPRRTVDKVYAVLTDANGRQSYSPAQVVPRPDVAAGFKQPNLVHAGFEVNADVSTLRGAYTLGLAVEHDGRLATCEQYRLHITFGQPAP
jgi:hypothetical protein